MLQQLLRASSPFYVHTCTIKYLFILIFFCSWWEKYKYNYFDNSNVCHFIIILILFGNTRSSLLTTATLMWTKLQDDKIDPNMLICRSGHSATAMGKKLLIFGGGTTNETGGLFLNDILVFDTESSKWQMAYACGPTPAGRTKHTASLIGSKLYVFGGGDGLRLFNDIFCLDVGM